MLGLYSHTTFLLSTTVHTSNTALYITTCLCLDYTHTQRSSYQSRSIPIAQHCTSQRVYAWTILTQRSSYQPRSIPLTQHYTSQRVYAWTIHTQRSSYNHVHTSNTVTHNVFMLGLYPHNVPPTNHDPYQSHSTLPLVHNIL